MKHCHLPTFMIIDLIPKKNKQMWEGAWGGGFFACSEFDIKRFEQLTIKNMNLWNLSGLKWGSN